MFCKWIEGFLGSMQFKNLQIYKELQVDRLIFGFWMPIRKSTNLQGMRYIYNQLPVTPSVRGEKSYSVLQMERWIFHDI